MTRAGRRCGWLWLAVAVSHAPLSLLNCARKKEAHPPVSLVIYVKPDCPYCQQARDHYNAQGIPFIEYDAQNDRARRKEMFAHSDGDPTVPCIVEDGVYKQSGWGDPLRG